MAEFATLHDAIQDLVPDGATVAMEGFTHLIPFAAGHEMIRQGKKDLTLVRMTPDVIYDQMIGMGLARKLVFSWGGNPGVGSLHRFRDAVEHGYPAPLELEEHSHAGMAARYAAGASGLPFAVLRAYVGSDLVKHTEVASIHCPFTGEELAAVPALNPDVAVIHAQQADRQGNVGMWGITGVQREAVLGARKAIVTVEEIVDELSHRGPNNVVLPSWTVAVVACVPHGSHPSYSMGYSTRDNAFYTEWDLISRDRDLFARWIEAFVIGTEDHAAYLSAISAQPQGKEALGG
ncbi:MAG TPA: CoA-transferase [Acidimicrobiia bacterium]|nr:CoA-transferase [Acidimicrobiia bacterium]